MHIIFEDHRYPAESVQKVLHGISELQDVNKLVSVSYVGYYYEPTLKDCVFILPKVLLNEKDQLVTSQGTISPEQIITPKGQKEHLSDEFRKFLYEFAVWIYRTIKVYYDTHPQSDAIYYKQLPQSGAGVRHQADTFLDIILSLIRFNNENQDFFLYIIKNIHSGFNKINWTRTIAHSAAIIQDQNPIYLNPVNKKRQINFDEELFVIFFSILDYINSEYGFRTPITLQYELLPKSQFQSYLKGRGKTRLKEIRYKYFSDKALVLWELCYAFFDNTHQLAVNTNNKEYLLAKKYEHVFEAMIDDLIGIPHNQIPKGLADQDDGKRVDHLYTDLALTSPQEQKREVYYIGDSKYYKKGHSLGTNSLAKQYTYARNVIQWNIDLWKKDAAARETEEPNQAFRSIRLRPDDPSEGYDIIPNFFLSAFVNDFHDTQSDISPRKTENKKTGEMEDLCYFASQFEDRLFDRDTLLLMYFDLNFLYIIRLYARQRTTEKQAWKEKVHKLFRDRIRKIVQDKFDIYAMRARLGIDGDLYIRDHFYELNGHVFQPYGPDNEVYYALALDKNNPQQAASIKNTLNHYFILDKCNMGENPADKLHDLEQQELSRPLAPSQWLTFHYLQRTPQATILFGYYKDDDHLRWILGNNDKGSLVYNVRLQVGQTETRDGAHTANFYKQKKVQFVVLYTDDYATTGLYRVFHVKDTAEVLHERMAKTWYPSVKDDGDYFFFRFDEEVQIMPIDIYAALKEAKSQHLETYHSLVDGEPVFLTCEELMNLCQ